MKLVRTLSKAKFVFTLLICCTYFILQACNTNTVTKPIQKRKFVLTKDSTFIGTWYGRIYDSRKGNDSSDTYYSFFSKDSILYLCTDYSYRVAKFRDEYHPIKPRNETDSSILAFSLQYYGSTMFTIKNNAINGTDNFLGNDSTIYTYCSSKIIGDTLCENDNKCEFIREYYKINSDNSLSFLHESQVMSQDKLHYITYERFVLLPYYYSKLN